MWGIQRNYERSTEIDLLRQALCIDFATYPYVSYDENTHLLQFRNEMGFMDYELQKEFIVREKDTFAIKTAESNLYFDGNPVITGPVDAIGLLTVKEQGGKTIFTFGENPAIEYMD